MSSEKIICNINDIPKIIVKVGDANKIISIFGNTPKIVAKFREAQNITFKVGDEQKIIVRFGERGLKGDGTKDHAALIHLGYDEAGHIGFQRALTYIDLYHAFEIQDN
jgi:hypothetical protein